MRGTVSRVVDPFLTETDRVLAQGYSAVLYGSAARGDFVPGRSDINLMLVLEQLTAPVLRSLSRAFSAWRKATPEPPLILSRAEWNRASDAFPIEITDMRLSYQVLRGSDPLAQSTGAGISGQTAAASPGLRQLCAGACRARLTGAPECRNYPGSAQGCAHRRRKAGTHGRHRAGRRRCGPDRLRA
jgi:predicted nucleotidyltransferase